MFKLTLKSFATFILVLFVAVPVFAKSSSEFTRSYHEEFAVNQDVMFNIKNKYGFVKVVTSPSKTVVVDVKIKVEASSQEKANKLMDRIRISISGGEDLVTAVTEIEKNTSFKSLSIDYTVNMPVTGQIDATNKFGDFYLNELDGEATIYVGYGALEIGELNHTHNNVTVKYGSGKIDYAHYINVVSRYSKMRVKRAKLLDLNSQYGEVQVGEVGRLVLKSAYEDIEIGTVVELEANVRFGDMEVEGIMGKFICDAQYGDVEVNFISKDFSEVEIASDFGDVDLAFESGSNFNLNGKASFGDISIPNGSISTVSGDNTQVYDGNLYEGTAPSSVVARISYGDLEISIY